MSQRKKMKMCGSCDAMVDLEVIICPYCGGDVSEVSEDPYKEEGYVKDGKRELSLDETMTSLYPPPYSMEEVEEEAKEKVEVSKKSSIILPFIMFSLGVNLLFFAIFLLSFSKDGEIFLRWNTSYWFIYVILGLPLLFFGNRFLTKVLKDE